MKQKKASLSNEESPLFITRKTACARYELSLPTLDRLINEGVIPVVKIGRRLIRIPKKTADKALLGLADLD